MANILLGVTGSVAAIKTPELFHLLRERGHSVRIVATRAARYFFDPDHLLPGQSARDPSVVSLDEDEWPGRDDGRRYQRGDEVLHIELRRWADQFLIAPLDANTLAKFASGMCDNCLTCVWRAWDPARPVILAPAMNTLMWEHPLTRRHLATLAELAGASLPCDLDQDQMIPIINDRCRTLRIVAPVSKALACGDIGVGAMASVADIAEVVDQVTSSLRSGSP